jgi:hypothetical protein
MNGTPILVAATAATVALVPPLRRRVVPVAKAMGHAGMGVGGAMMHGVSDVVGTAVHGHPGDGAAIVAAAAPRKRPASHARAAS